MLSKKALQDELTQRSLPYAARWNKDRLRKRLFDHDGEMSFQPYLPPFPFTKLPIELRKMIYELVLAGEEEICVSVDDPFRSGFSPESRGVHPEQRRLEREPFNPVWEYSLNISCRFGEPEGRKAYSSRFALLRANRQMYHEAREYVVKHNTIRFDLAAGSFYAHRTAERDSPSTDPSQWWRFFGSSFDEDERLHYMNLSKNSPKQVLMLRRREGRISENAYPRLSLEHCPGVFVPAPFEVSEPRSIKVVLDFYLDSLDNYQNQFPWLSSFRSVMQIFVNNVLEPAERLGKLEVCPHVPLRPRWGFNPEIFPYDEMKDVFRPLEALRGLKEVKLADGMMLPEDYRDYLIDLMTSPKIQAPSEVQEESALVEASSTLLVEAESVLQLEVKSLFGGGSLSSGLGK